MSEKRFIWGALHFKADPKKCYEEIQTLGEYYTPHDIVDLARNPETELHKCFDWNDETAAEKWRVQTARLICCNLKAVVISEKGKEQEYRLIQSDSSLPAYKPVTLTVRNDDEYSRLLEKAKAELASFRKRYSMIVELEQVIDEIDRIINS